MTLNADAAYNWVGLWCRQSSQGSSSLVPPLVSVVMDQCGSYGSSTSLPVTLLGLCKQGFRGFKGEKGEPGQPGLDGLDAPCQLVQYFSSSFHQLTPACLSPSTETETMHDLRASTGITTATSHYKTCTTSH